MRLLSVILRAVTWWNSQTIGTQFFTWRRGVKVGEDAQGNVFYQTKNGARRWVIFNGETEASRVSPDWHGWLHHTWHKPPTEEPLIHKEWEKEHQANTTGTMKAYAPVGSLRHAAPSQRNDYEAWKPE